MSNITLTWDSDGSIESFSVYRAEQTIDTNNLPAPIATGITDKTYIDRDVIDDKTYFYRVASNKVSQQKVSDEVSLAANQTAPILVDYVASFYTTAQSQTRNLPTTIQDNDLLIAVVMHRDTLTLPNGWALLSQNFGKDNTFAQYMSIIYKTAIRNDANTALTLTQATSTRLASHILVFRHNNGCVISQNIGQDKCTVNNQILLSAELTASKVGMGLVCANWIYAQTGVSTSYSLGNGYTALGQTKTDDANHQIRQAVGYKEVKLGEKVTSNITTSNGPETSAERACTATLLIAAK